MNPRAVIDHAALRHNLGRVREAAPHSRVWAVIKADAYGHGVEQVWRSLDADGYAVARLGEAQRLRQFGVRRPILVMGGVHDARELERAAELACELAVHAPEQGRLFETARLGSSSKVWLKVNTGMNRLGMPPELVPEWLRRLSNSPAVQGSPGLMTHLANADELDDPTTEQQCRRLRDIPAPPETRYNIGNSAGLLGFACARSDWVRPGIMLYGVSPFLNETAVDRGLRPVMTLRAPLIAVNHCRRGDRVGYGGSYQCPEDMPMGVIGIGYGDGYPRHAPTGTPVLLNGRRLPLAGRVSMDMITVDLRGQPMPQLGDEAILWGTGLPVEDVAQAAGTIAYELLTAVTARVPREHIDLAG